MSDGYDQVAELLAKKLSEHMARAVDEILEGIDQLANGSEGFMAAEFAAQSDRSAQDLANEFAEKLSSLTIDIALAKTEPQAINEQSSEFCILLPSGRMLAEDMPTPTDQFDWKLLAPSRRKPVSIRVRY